MNHLNNAFVTSHRQPREYQIGDPLSREAHMLRLEHGLEAMMDIETPAFVRRCLKLGLPKSVLSSQTLGVLAPISRLLNIILGDDGIIFPIDEGDSNPY